MRAGETEMFRNAAFIREGEAPAEPGVSNGIPPKWEGEAPAEPDVSNGIPPKREGEAPAEPRLSKDPALHALSMPTSPLYPPTVFRGKRVELATAHERVQEGGCTHP